jgi:4-hydroxy-3-polyprenylbenzoate decarboxylase
VVSGDIDIRNYKRLLTNVFANVDFNRDLLFSHGPLDVLDHSSDNFSFGGKAGVDATIKHVEESTGRNQATKTDKPEIFKNKVNFLDRNIIKHYNLRLLEENIPVLIISVNRSEDTDVIEKVKNMFRANGTLSIFKLIVIVDHTVDVDDLFMVAWQLLGNSDPQRDHEFIFPGSIFLDGTIKAYRKGGFPRKWPNIVCSESETISTIDKKWDSLGIGTLINSPSSRYIGLCRSGNDEIIID